MPGLQAAVTGQKLPDHVKAVEAGGIGQVKLIDATPIGINVRSTVATYAGVHDELRKIFARSPEAKALGYKAGDFSYNTGRLRCPPATAPASSAWMLQFCPTWTFPAPTAGAPGMPGMRPRVQIQNKAGRVYLAA